MTDEVNDEVYVLSKLEVAHLRISVAGALEELENLHPQNYYINELRDCLTILNGDGE
jgi:hypothetical protein